MPSTGTDIQSLASRVEKLEAANRRWKSVSTLLVLSGVSLLLLGAKPADRLDSDVIRARTVEAQDFVLKDENGHVYGRLSLGPMSGLKLNDKTFVLPPGFSGHASLQFYENGQVVWSAPSKPQLMPVR